MRNGCDQLNRPKCRRKPPSGGRGLGALSFSRGTGSHSSASAGFPATRSQRREVPFRCASWNVAALERSDNVADRDHAFAMLKRGYTQKSESGDSRGMLRGIRSNHLDANCPPFSSFPQ